VLALVAAAIPWGSSEADATTYCFGEVVTLTATAGVPLTGTPQKDVIRGSGGADWIDGAGGNDLICGLAGDDQLLGGAGRDKIDGGDGIDAIDGGDGNDRLLGGRGRDVFYHSAGIDQINGQGGRDTFDVSAVVPGNPQPGHPSAGLTINFPANFYEGYTFIDGSGGIRAVEMVIGSKYDEFIHTHGTDVNVIRAGPGADTIWANSPGDRVFGQGGPDVLQAFASFLTLRGGGGDDTVWSDYRTDIAGGHGYDHCALDMDVAGTTCEKITLLCGTANVPVPVTATNVTTRTGDFDGDGTADDLQVFRDAGAWWTRIATAAGFETIESLATNPAATARAVGGHDIDGDGVDEAFLVVGQGASSEIVGIYTLYQPIGSPATGFSCGVVPAVFDTVPARAEFAIDAGLFQQTGLACRSDNTVREFVQATIDQVTYKQRRYDHTYDPGFATTGPVLSYLRKSAKTFTSPADDTLINKAGQFTCPGLSL
jgi:Ca2+-binding RTX toxin-like protein